MGSTASKKQSRKAKTAGNCVDRMWTAYVSVILLWASYAPLGISFLAWIAPWGWLRIVRAPKLNAKSYVQLWLSGCLFWLAILQGIRLAYWPLYFGWLALSLYLAIFIPWFVAVARSLTRLRVPLWLAAPIAWVGLEMARSYLLTGYCANTLALSQIHHPMLVQIADQLGGYGVSFLVMLVSAASFEFLESFAWFRRFSTTGTNTTRAKQNVAGTSTASKSKADQVEPSNKFARTSWLGLAIATVCLAANLVYGAWKIQQADQLAASQEPMFRALLVQENTPTMFDAELSDLVAAWERYLVTTRRSVAEKGCPDVVVWPESTFTAGLPWFADVLPDKLPPEYDGVDRDFVKQRMRELALEFEYKSKRLIQAVRDGVSDASPESAVPMDDDELADPDASNSPAGSTNDTNRLADACSPYLLVGCDAVEIRSQGDARHNSAMWVTPDAELLDRYDKMHLVMFGEYIPLGPLLKPLRDAFGLRTAFGTEPKSFQLIDARISPNICFESMMPRVISGQVRELVTRGEAPDVLVNVSNDSWFRGSSMLDHHLACTMLCAIENRRPVLVAANTGISAHVDGAGRVLQSSERFEAVGIFAAPTRDSRPGLVQWAGYPLGWICMVAGLAVWLAGWFPGDKRTSS